MQCARQTPNSDIARLVLLAKRRCTPFTQRGRAQASQLLLAIGEQNARRSQQAAVHGR
jgi:hypothetical protein